jgi:DNA-directed RNA polymerase subunit RPC12/RpoP
MARFFGVTCKGCGKHIPLAEVEPENEKEITFYVLPLGPIACPHCKHQDQYANKDRVFK